MRRLGGLFALAASLAVLGGAVAEARRMAPEVRDVAILSDAMPRTLEEYGFFIDAPGQIPTLGVTPYELNTPLYSDGADKLRFAYVPVGKAIGTDGESLLQFPVGSALIKTFAFGEGDDRRLIETRVLLHRESGWVALPYRWNSEQTEARLAIAGGRLDIETPDHGTISYRIPNKNQCKECHGLDGEVVPIGPKARNLSDAWLQSIVGEVPEGADSLPDWSQANSDETASLARAYLDVNCAHCHRPGATASNSGLDLRWEQTDPHALGVYKRPVAAGRGSGGHEFSVQPGDPDRSIMSFRMASTEPGVAMPELGKATVDEEGLRIVRDWIAGMTP